MDIKKLVDSVKQSNQKDESALLAALQAILALSNLLKLLNIDNQLNDITSKINQLTGTPQPADNGPSLKDVLPLLEDVCETKVRDSKTFFLLHRFTENFEYQNSKTEDGHYNTQKDTSWSVEQGVPELEQDRSEATLKGANPMVSCWIPQDAISSVKGGQANTGTWGELGENPHKNHFQIYVKPGKYEIYSELKQ